MSMASLFLSSIGQWHCSWWQGKVLRECGGQCPTSGVVKMAFTELKELVRILAICIHKGVRQNGCKKKVWTFENSF
jgi:hypothetical protein